MDDKPTERPTRKITGWILFTIGVLLGLYILIERVGSGGNISKTLGEVMWPILIALIGLYLAGIIKKIR